MAQNSFQTISLSANLTLLWSFSFETQGTKINDINNVVPTANGFKIFMPDATLAVPGQSVQFTNTSTFSFQIVAADTTTIIATVAAGQSYQIYLNGNQTATGTWNAIPAGGGTSNINSVTAISSSNSVVISGSPLSPPGGTLDIGLPTSLTNLLSVLTTGIAVITGTGPLTWRTARLVGGLNINITNDNATAGNPVINLSNSLTGLSSAAIGDLTLSGSVITTDLVNGDIQISSAGTGKIFLNGVQIDTSGNIRGISNLVGFRAFGVFTDTVTISGNTISIQDRINLTSITGSHGSYNVTLTSPMANINYGVLATTFTPGGSNPPIYTATIPSSSRTTTGFTIQVVDASGEPVLALPSGMTFTVVSSSF